MTARAADGTEVVVYPETIASQVICIIEGDSGEQKVGLDYLLNQYADEIGTTGQGMSTLQTSKVRNGMLYHLLNIGYIDADGAGGAFSDTKPSTAIQLQGERLNLNPYSFVPYKPPQDAARFVVFDGFASVAGGVLTIN
jgi:hypothetical protein